jgi:hypothetical protein
VYAFPRLMEGFYSAQAFQFLDTGYGRASYAMASFYVQPVNALLWFATKLASFEFSLHLLGTL